MFMPFSGATCLTGSQRLYKRGLHAEMRSRDHGKCRKFAIGSYANAPLEEATMSVARMVVLVLVAIFLEAAAPLATQSCTRVDPSFARFLRHFKSDSEFRYSRLVLPLKFSE